MMMFIRTPLLMAILWGGSLGVTEHTGSPVWLMGLCSLSHSDLIEIIQIRLVPKEGMMPCHLLGCLHGKWELKVHLSVLKKP